MKSCINILLLLLLLFSPGLIFAQSINDIKKEKEKSEKEIAYLNKLLEEARSSKSVSVEKLNILQQKIIQSKRILNSLNNEVKYLENHISGNEKRIEELLKERESLHDLYSKLIYGTWKKRNKTNKLMFIFSSADFNQAYNRYKYFEQIQEYSNRQLQVIAQVNDSLAAKNQEMKTYVDQKNSTLTVINQKNEELVVQQKNENSYIKELQQRERNIVKKLNVENNNRKKLAAKLDKLIAAQSKKSGSSSEAYKLTPQEKLISDDFAKNKGRLPWPVNDGFISEGFGLNTHPVYKRVQMLNNGVNITTSKNSAVRAVFSGTVSAIWLMPGFNNVVIVRHGSYLTVYSNLIEINVKEGQKVTTKETIGKIAFDSEKGSILNFQVWKDMDKLDPELWLAK